MSACEPTRFRHFIRQHFKSSHPVRTEFPTTASPNRFTRRGSLLPLLSLTGVIMLAGGCGASVATGDAGKADPGHATVTIRVSAAASLTELLTTLEPVYEADHPETDLVFMFGASGALAEQIAQGAPADLFLSAAAQPMDKLDKAGLLAGGTRIDCLANRLVLVVPATRASLEDFSDAASDAVQRLAIGDPATVPAGAYAMEAFDHLGIIDEVKRKAVYAKDVRAVLAWVAAGEADAGVVYASDVLHQKKVVRAATADDSLHAPILYPGAVMSASAHAEEAEGFLRYLADPGQDAVIESFGFTRP